MFCAVGMIVAGSAVCCGLLWWLLTFAVCGLLIWHSIGDLVAVWFVLFVFAVGFGLWVFVRFGCCVCVSLIVAC